MKPTSLPRSITSRSEPMTSRRPRQDAAPKLIGCVTPPLLQSSQRQRKPLRLTAISEIEGGNAGGNTAGTSWKRTR